MLMRYQLKFDSLVNEMLDELPEEVWKSEITTFFDPAMAGGQFIGQVIARLRNYGHSDENINGRIFGMECSKLMVTVVQNKYKIGTYWVGDVNYEFKKMKFDNVLSNPPYQHTINPDKKGKSGGIPLYLKFIKLGISLLKDGGVMSFVTPPGYFKSTVWGVRHPVAELVSQYQIDYLDFTAKTHFTVGTKIFAFQITKVPYHSPTLIKTKEETFELDLRNVFYLPSEISKMNINILNAITAKRTGIQLNFSRTDASYNLKPNTAFITRFGHWYPDTQSNLTSHVLRLECTDFATAQRIVDCFKTKFWLKVKHLITSWDAMTYHKFLSGFFVPSISEVEIISDETLCEYYGLTQEQTEYMLK